MSNLPNVYFSTILSSLVCRGCGDEIALSRYTLARPDVYAEEKQMAEMLHADCTGTPYEAGLQRRWREQHLRMVYA